MANQKSNKDYFKLLLIIIIVLLIGLLALSTSNNQMLQGLLINAFGLSPSVIGFGCGFLC